MRALMLHQYGEPPSVTETARPTPVGEQVEATVLAAGLNPVDLSLADGLLGTDRVLPHPVGNEAVVVLGGRRVYSQRTSGSVAESTLVDPHHVLDVPDGTDPMSVFLAGISGQPAWIPLETTAGLQAGETVLVLGATGAAGQVATQAAKLLGAGRVVAAGRHRPTLETLLTRGADDIVVLDGRDDGAALLEATRGGADVVYDPLWGPAFVAALKATKPGGRTVTVGRSAGELTAAVPVFDLLGKSVLSYRNGATPAETVEAAFRRMLRHAADGELVVETTVFPLDRAEDAWLAQQRTPHAKVVVDTR